MKGTHEIRAGYGIWELAAETEDVILQLKAEGLDLSYVVFFLTQVYEKTEDVDPKAKPRRLFQVKWRPAGGSTIHPDVESRLQETMPCRPAEARSGDPQGEWDAIYRYVLVRIASGVH